MSEANKFGKKTFEWVVELAETKARTLGHQNNIDNCEIEHFVHNGKLKLVYQHLTRMEAINSHSEVGKKCIAAFKDECARVFGADWQAHAEMLLSL